VYIGSNERHWHGAAPNTFFVHIAITLHLRDESILSGQKRLPMMSTNGSTSPRRRAWSFESWSELKRDIDIPVSTCTILCWRSGCKASAFSGPFGQSIVDLFKREDRRGRGMWLAIASEAPRKPKNS